MIMQSTVEKIVAGKTNSRALTSMLNQVLIYMENALAENEALMSMRDVPRCASCGATENLTPGYVAGGNVIDYCPVCRADEERR
jgi:hypothetical protein